MKIRGLVLSLLALFAIGNAQAAATYTEDFEAPFPAWESGWFGVNSDAYNVYCARPCSDRGNNPDGLWLGGVGGAATVDMPIDVNFQSGFGAGIRSMSLDIAAYTNTTLRVYDIGGTEIFSQLVTLTYGAVTDPGVYVTYSISSPNGISHFSFDGEASGNTSIDNIVVGTAEAVPEPQTAALVLVGLVLAGCTRRRRSAR